MSTVRNQCVADILETAPEGIITFNDQGIIATANAAAKRIFGYSTPQLVGRNFSMLFAANHQPDVERCLRGNREKKVGTPIEMAGRRKNGKLFPMDFSVSEVKPSARGIFSGFIRDITERKRLEKEILEISDREQRRVGQDLHDGLCQHLAGIELMSHTLAKKLASKSKADANQVTEIARHVRDAISHTRSLARELSPVTIESEGLTSALHELAANTEKTFRLECRCDLDELVEIADHASATHLFRIAQEAVSNALQHGKARTVVIALRKSRGRVILNIADNGRGFPRRPSKKGIGLRIMQSRASMIGGIMTIEPLRNGVSVTCILPQARSPGKI